MNRELYVKMTEEEYELFKQLKPIEKYSIGELASTLYNAISKNPEGRVSESIPLMGFDDTNHKAAIRQGNFYIELLIAKDK